MNVHDGGNAYETVPAYTSYIRNQGQRNFIMGFGKKKKGGKAVSAPSLSLFGRFFPTETWRPDVAKGEFFEAQEIGRYRSNSCMKLTRRVLSKMKWNL